MQLDFKFDDFGV